MAAMCNSVMQVRREVTRVFRNVFREVMNELCPQSWIGRGRWKARLPH